jgi:hypothetical protein
VAPYKKEGNSGYNVTLLCSALQAFIIKQSILKQGVLMMVNGGLAAAAAYLVGWGLQKALGTSDEC